MSLLRISPDQGTKRAIFVIGVAAILLIANRAPAADFALGLECPAEVSGTAGQEVTFDVFVTLSTTNNDTPEGAQGWSFGVKIAGATVDPSTFYNQNGLGDPAMSGLNLKVNTILFPSFGPPQNPFLEDLFNSFFAFLEPAYTTPAQDGVRPPEDVPVGVTSAIVINGSQKQVLQPLGTQRIARLTIKASIPETPAAITLNFENGLYYFHDSSGLNSAVTFEGRTSTPALGECSIQVKKSLGAQFKRGDADGNGTNDINDATFIINCQFLGGPCPDCMEAADVNDDGRVDIADPVYFIKFQFLGGPPPNQPFPGCGVNPTPDGLSCDSFPPCR